MKSKRFIGFIDVLGFKELVHNNTHSRLTELYAKVFSPGVNLGLSNGRIKIIYKNKKKYWEPDFASINVNSLIISDSVIIWTDDNSMKAFIDIIASARTLLNHSFLTGFPLRGAIVEGDLTILKSKINGPKDNSINTLVGMGLVNAYKLESEQNWSGCIVDDSCINTYNSCFNEHKDSFNELADINYLIEKELLVKYKAPLKTGIIQEKYVIDWVNMKNKNTFLDEINIRNKFSKFNKSVDDWKVEQLIKNTLDFIKITLK